MNKEYTWKSDIAQKSQQFLQIKHMTGFKYDSQKKYLQRFDAYYFQNGYTGIRITKEMADGFIYSQDERVSGWYLKERHLRDFALFLKDLCYSEIYVPVVQSAPPRSSFTPYIFTNDEIKRFFKALDSWEDSPLSNRVIIDPVFFRLLYSTGMRLSEALNLTVKDFDNAVLTVYHAKNNKDRLVPLHPNMTEKLKTYTGHMHQFSKESNYLFPSTRGYDYCIDKSTIHRRFRQYLSRAGISLTGTGPRIHCLRYPNLNKIQTFYKKFEKLAFFYQKGLDFIFYFFIGLTPQNSARPPFISFHFFDTLFDDIQKIPDEFNDYYSSSLCE